VSTLRTSAITLLALTISTHGQATDVTRKRSLTNTAACDLLIHAFPAGALHSDESTPGAMPWCDTTSNSKSPYAVMGLHSDRRCDYICSSLVGWYAVERKTGKIFAWDINEDVVGALLWDGSSGQISLRKPGG
jgi:hypothetical protein